MLLAEEDFGPRRSDTREKSKFFSKQNTQYMGSMIIEESKVNPHLPPKHLSA